MATRTSQPFQTLRQLPLEVLQSWDDFFQRFRGLLIEQAGTLTLAETRNG